MKITSVTNGRPGSAPVVTFTVLNNAGAAVPLSALGSISFTMAGPTSDYGYTSFGSDVTTPGYVTESAAQRHLRRAAGTARTPSPTSFRRGDRHLRDRRRSAANRDRAWPEPPRSKASSTERRTRWRTSRWTARRSRLGAQWSRWPIAISATYRCQLHGTLRNNTEYCVMCHNPSNTDFIHARRARRSPLIRPRRRRASTSTCWCIAFTTASTCRRPTGVTWWSVSAEAITISSEHAVPGAEPNRRGHRYSRTAPCATSTAREQNDCPDGLNPVIDPQGPINPIQPISSACTGCHVDLPAASHTLSNTTSLGEACAVCHGSGAAYAVDQVHAQY